MTTVQLSASDFFVLITIQFIVGVGVWKIVVLLTAIRDELVKQRLAGHA